MKHYNYDSSKNQTIKGHFVQREVKACISDMAEYLFGVISTPIGTNGKTYMLHVVPNAEKSWTKTNGTKWTTA